MRNWVMPIAMLALVAGLGSPPCRAADAFVPPAENVLVFRRDRLPIDVESMAGLSSDLLTLAKAHGGKGAAKRRTVAQFLALASALQPASAQVTEFATAYGSGKRDFSTSPNEVQQARQRVREALAWLGSAGGNEDARALAACLGDVVAAFDPDHPDSQKHLANGEQGAWQGWVQPVEAFTTRKIQTQIEPDPELSTPKPPTIKPDPEPQALAVKLPEASLLTVAWTTDKPGATRELRPIAIAMKAGALPPPEKDDDDDKKKDTENESEEIPKRPFQCGWNNPKVLSSGDFDAHSDAHQLERQSFQKAATSAVSAAETRLGTLPTDTQAVFSPGTTLIFRAEKDTAALSGPLAVLVHSAFSGRKSRGAVIAEVRSDGSLHLPPDFWLRLRSLPANGVDRLVLPRAAEAYLPSLLALEVPEVFLNSEVLLADDFDDLLALSTGTGEEAVVQACAAFQEIRSTWGKKPVGPFVNSRTVRQRLEVIVRQAPCHGSARMLAIQGAAQRPTKLPKALLAQELLNITKRTDWIASASSTENLLSQNLVDIAESAKAPIAALDRYTEIRDRELNDTAGEILVALRTLSRAVRNRSDSQGNRIDHWEDLQAFKKVHKSSTEKLRASASLPP